MKRTATTLALLAGLGGGCMSANKMKAKTEDAPAPIMPYGQVTKPQAIPGVVGPTGTHAFAWIARDLNPHGVVGDASVATAAKGRAVAELQARGFVELLKEVRAVKLSEGFGAF